MEGPGVQRVYGIELAGGRITVVRAAKRRGRAVTSVLVESADAASDELARVREEVNSECRSGRAIVVCACPAQDSFVRVVEAPLTSEKKARAVFPSMLDVQLPFPLEQCSYRFVHVHGIDGGRTRAVAVAVPDERCRQFLDAVREAGFDPEWIEQEALALWRYGGRTGPAESGNGRVIIYAGLDRTVAVVGKEGVPAASLSTHFSWTAGADADGRERFVRKLKQQVAGSLGAGAERTPQYLVCGPGAAGDEEGLREAVGVQPENWTVGDATAGCLACVLAENVLRSDGWNANLRGGGLEHPHVQTLRRRARLRAAAGIVAASLVLAAVSVASPFYMNMKHGQLRDALQKRAKETTGLAVVPRGQEVFIAKQHIDADADTYRVFNDWLTPTRYPLLKDVLETSQKLGITLETVALLPASVHVKGTSSDWRHAESLAAPLQDGEWRTEIERKDAGEDERVHFTLKAQR